MTPFSLPLFVTTILACGACASLPSEHQDQFLLVHKDGYVISTDQQPADFDVHIWPAMRKGIDKYIEQVEKEDSEARRNNPDLPSRIPRLLIFVHGGMNRYKTDLDRVRDFIEAQKKNPDWDLSKYHLIFINWDSDPFSSIYDDVFEVRIGERYGFLGYASSPFIAAARFVQAGLLGPQSAYLDAANFAESIGFKAEQKWTECAPEPRGADMDPTGVIDGSRFIVLYPLRLASLPFIQGFGAPSWEGMKRRASLVMGPEGSLRRAASLRNEKEDTAVGGGWQLFNALRKSLTDDGEWIDQNGTRHHLSISLVGHSMGTMVLNDVVEEFSDLEFKEIIYLAAAASIDDVRGAIIPYLRRHQRARFWGFSLAETLEAAEINYVDMYERGSLLIWIDHFFEKVNVPGDRTFGRARNLRQYFKIPAEFTSNDPSASRFFLTKFGRGADDPRMHGDFTRPHHLERVLEIVETNSCRKATMD